MAAPRNTPSKGERPALVVTSNGRSTTDGPTPSVRRELEFSDDLPLSVLLSGERVDRLRIQVETWEGVGGGIAEVRVF